MSCFNEAVQEQVSIATRNFGSNNVVGCAPYILGSVAGMGMDVIDPFRRASDERNSFLATKIRFLTLNSTSLQQPADQTMATFYIRALRYLKCASEL